MNVLPQPRQATGEKTIGLLRRVLTDQLQLAQGLGDLHLRFGGQACEQFFGTGEAETINGNLEIFRRRGHRAVGVTIRLTQDAQGQRRAVLHQIGDVAQRAAIVTDRPADFVVRRLRHGQPDAVEQLDPAVEGGRFCVWDVRFISHVWTGSSVTVDAPGMG